jgi:hypothetical protein
VGRGARAAASAALVAVVCALFVAAPGGTSTSTSTGAAAGPACTKAAARKAVVSTGFARRVKARLGASVFRPGESVLGLFGVGQLLCADITGDSRREMIVLLQCCTVSAPSPWAIFKAGARGRWALRYSRIKTVAFRLRVDAARDVEAKSPHYAPSDPNCCPSSYDYVRAHWTGRTFVTLRGRG